MNKSQFDNTEHFTSIDDIIFFYTQAEDSQHNGLEKKELEQKNQKNNK
jgi:hypothetical protein